MSFSYYSPKPPKREAKACDRSDSFSAGRIDLHRKERCHDQLVLCAGRRINRQNSVMADSAMATGAIAPWEEKKCAISLPEAKPAPITPLKSASEQDITAIQSPPKQSAPHWERGRQRRLWGDMRRGGKKEERMRRVIRFFFPFGRFQAIIEKWKLREESWTDHAQI